MNLISKEKTQKADAIIWLQGDRYDRARKVIGLFKKGFGKKIFLTGNNILVGDKKRPGTDNITLTKMEEWLEKNGIGRKEIIIDNKSFHTADQAEKVLRFAKKNKWKKIILVGSLFYQPRAFLTFLKRNNKIGWQGEIVNQPAIIGLSVKPGGRNETVKTLILEEIEKIKKYRSDIAGFKEGLNYLENK
ncbi:MAG: YdcF family protein [Candidatus Parcubacteria bacterium]|nr:YdcF family protein [Candidatus Parcubacteria bacterium]